MNQKTLIIITVIILSLIVVSLYLYQDHYLRKDMVAEYLKEQIAEIESSSEPLDTERQRQLEYLKGDFDFAIKLGDYQATYRDLFENNKEVEKYYYEKVK